MPNDPLWNPDEVTRGVLQRRKITVSADVPAVTDHPASLHGLYTAIFGAGVTPYLNSISFRNHNDDPLGALLAFDPATFDGTNFETHFKITKAAAAKDFYLYYSDVTNPPTSQANVVGTYSNGFVGVWHMGDAGPTNVLDSLGVNNGVQSGGVTFGATGQIGKACTFDGTNDLVTANGVAGAAFFDGAHTISGWAKLTAWTANRTVFGAGNGLPAVQYSEIDFNNPSQKLYARAWGSGAENAVPSLVTYTNDSGWHHLMTCVDANGGIVGFYIDGVLQGSNTTNITQLDTTDKFFIGQLVYWVPNVNPWQGTADLVSVSSGIRASAWPLAETLFGLGTAVTVGAVEEYQAGHPALRRLGLFDTGFGFDRSRETRWG